MSTVVVVGAGMMGTALCTPLADAGHSVRLVGTHLDAAWVDAMRVQRAHPKLHTTLPDAVQVFAHAEIDEAMRDAEVIAVGVSSAGVRWAADTVAPFLRPDMPVLSVTKGLEASGAHGLCILLDVLEDALRARESRSPCVAVAGPCIAGELARRVPTSVVFASRDTSAAERLANAVATSYYHVRISGDPVAVQVCAALKNAYAMAVGIATGVHERTGGRCGPVAYHNYEAAVFAQACVEMHTLVSALGGDPRHVANLAGAGDLLVTCSGGRSSRLGRLLGLGRTFREARSEMAQETLESADTVLVVGRALDDLIARGTLTPRALPLMRHLYGILARDEPVRMPFEEFFRDGFA